MLPAEDLFVYVYVLTDDLIAAQIIAIPRRLACLARMVWLFWAAPLVGAALAGIVYRFVGGAENPAPVEVRGDS